jgi:uncharacterized membrane protein
VFSFLKKKPFFNEQERQQIVAAVQSAEHRTSGEIRVYIESHCKYVDALDMAAELFFGLNMTKTQDRNAVLLYFAMKDKQLAVFGDEGIHKKVGEEYWNREVQRMLHQFNKDNYADGIRDCVIAIGEALHQHFPYNKDTDKNELPDDIVFGK